MSKTQTRYPRAFSYVYFAFKGNEFDPAEITRRLGIEPTKFWLRGQINAERPVPVYTMWQYSVTITGNEYELIKLIRRIVDLFHPKTAIINALKQEFDLRTILQVVMYAYYGPDEITPWLSYDEEAIRFLYETGSTTDLDLYLMEEETSEEE